jgi:peptidoglycan/xylan/chitin deacetylase (PgdA/CDA1 family)
MRPAALLRSAIRTLTRRVRPQGLILLYHRVATPDRDPWQLCVTPEHFEEHLAVLEKFRPGRLRQLTDSMLPRSVAVTFDDGYADNLHCAARLLQKHDIPATFFLTSGYLGGHEEFWWDELERRLASTAPGADHAWLPVYYKLYDVLQPLADTERRRILGEIGPAESFGCARESHRVLTMDELSELAGMALFEIGAHTVTHPRLAEQTPQEQLAEMRESKRFLESAVGRNIDSFSYPFGGRGHYSAESVEMAREAGFSEACTTTPGVVDRNSDRFELPRLVIEDMDGDRFEHLLNCYLTNTRTLTE